jgi:HSP20 family molecular chaperone IbpA
MHINARTTTFTRLNLSPDGSPPKGSVMNALARRERLEDLMPDFFRRLAWPIALAGEPGDIRVDVTENDKDYQVRAEIPGAKKEDIRVSVDGVLKLTLPKREGTGARAIAIE